MRFKRTSPTRCENKMRYDSAKEAKKAAGIIARQRGMTMPMTPYKCNHCGGYHLTSHITFVETPPYGGDTA